MSQWPPMFHWLYKAQGVTTLVEKPLLNSLSQPRHFTAWQRMSSLYQDYLQSHLIAITDNLSLTRFCDDFSHTVFQMEANCMKIRQDTLLYLHIVQSRAGKVQLGHLIHSSSPLLQDCPLQYTYQICPYPYLAAQAMSFHQFSSTKEVGAWLMFKHTSSLSKWKERSPWN